jgi:predicted DNA-binding ribbon-helix-helix protein
MVSPLQVGRSMKSLVVKHSVNIDDHRTSISLEEVFWTALKEIARERGETLKQLIAGINANRQSANLSSALRIFVLRHYMDQYARQRELFEQREIPVQ